MVGTHWRRLRTVVSRKYWMHGNVVHDGNDDSDQLLELQKRMEVDVHGSLYIYDRY